MKKIIYYGNGCPKCKILTQKLQDANIENYEICNDVQKMLDLGIKTVPMLDIDGTLLSFAESVTWIKQQKEDN